MKPRTLERIESQSEDTKRLQERLQEWSGDFAGCPLLGGRLVESVRFFEHKQVTVKHGLGRRPEGMIVVKNESPHVQRMTPRVYESDSVKIVFDPCYPVPSWPHPSGLTLSNLTLSGLREGPFDSGQACYLTDSVDGGATLHSASIESGGLGIAFPESRTTYSACFAKQLAKEHLCIYGDLAPSAVAMFDLESGSVTYRSAAVIDAGMHRLRASVNDPDNDWWWCWLECPSRAGNVDTATFLPADGGTSGDESYQGTGTAPIMLDRLSYGTVEQSFLTDLWVY